MVSSVGVALGQARLVGEPLHRAPGVLALGVRGLREHQQQVGLVTVEDERGCVALAEIIAKAI